MRPTIRLTTVTSPHNRGRNGGYYFLNCTVIKFLMISFVVSCAVLLVGLLIAGRNIKISNPSSYDAAMGSSVSDIMDRPYQVDASGQGAIDTRTSSDPRASMVPAYVASLIKCEEGSSVTGFLDAAIILRHSIHKNSVHNPGSSGKYSYKMYAIVHENCKQFTPVLEKAGYEAIVRATPIDRSKIKGDEYRKNVEKSMCCGSAEFIKMYAYTLVDHPVVAHFDLDKIILKPMDDLFDAIIFPHDSEIGRIARSKLDLEWEEDRKNLPKQIDAFFTRDYTSSWPWKRVAGVQGGFLVVRPSQRAFDQYMEIILEGNFTMGFNDESGWGGLGFGGWIGGMAFQGVVPYFYDHFHPNTAVELNVCRWNQVAADVIWRGPKGKDSIGKCNKYPRFGSKAVCEDCRQTPVENTWTLHYTACKKPWSCPTERENQKERHRIDTKIVNMEMCYKHHSEWFKLRKEFDSMLASATGNVTIKSQNVGGYRKDAFHGYCKGEKGYIPIFLPEYDNFDVRKIYEN